MNNYRTNNNNNYSKKALVIAVSDYDKSSSLKSIQFCKNDGQEMYNVLKKNGYDIPDDRKLIGYVDYQTLKNAIYDFFTDENNKPDDTLIFYYSGHGVPDKLGTIFLAPSDINSNHPFISGFSFDDLTNSMLASNSESVVTILDSCFSGSLKISKGLDSKSGEEAATRIANSRIEEKSNKLKQGVGRCLLAASQGYEEAYDRQEKDHSIFTYYLLEGLKGHKNAVDDEGNVTYDTLGKFITREIVNLDPDKRPKQTPIRKSEVSGGEIVLANYPNLRKTKEFNIFSNDITSLNAKGVTLYNQGKYQEAIELFEEALKIDPNNISIHINRFLALKKIRKGDILHDIDLPELPKLDQNHWLDLLRSIEEKRCLPFIGYSVLDEFFSLKEIVIDLAKKNEYPFEDFYQIPKVAQFLAINYQFQDELYPKRILSQEIKKIKIPNFSLEEYKNTPYAVLADLNLPIYITTNYDYFMEAALESRGKRPVTEICRWNEDLYRYTKEAGICSVFDKGKDYEKNEQENTIFPKYSPKSKPYRPTIEEPLVYHLYGIVDEPSSMVLTERDYSNFITYMNREREENTIPIPVRKALATSSLLFIGYRLDSDLDFRTLFDGAISFTHSFLRRKSLAVLQVPLLENANIKINTKLEYFRNHLRNMFDFNVYWQYSDEFIQDLASKWKEFKEDSF